jgi:ABC-type transporter Mla maintaining outer membrane lipid asymmetry permease subunit MlaE
VGFILLLIPGFYAIGVLCLWPVALYGDDAASMQALGVSRDLVKGHWWRTTTILTVSIIIILVFTFIVGLVTGIFSVFTHRDLMAAQLYGQLVGVVANVFALPAIPAVLVAIYNDLKLRREGGDLAARLGALPAS